MIDWNLLQRYPSLMTPLQWGFVIVTFSLAIWSIVWLRSYFREDAEDEDETLEMLTQFRELHQQGGLSHDEFRLIRSRLSRNVQAASLTEQTEPKVIAVTCDPSIAMDPQSDASSHSPDEHATPEDLEKSERMPDNEME